MKKRLTLSLCGWLILSAPAFAYTPYGDDNPFVEAMLRMMEMFGLIDRNRLPLGVPYLPGYPSALGSGLAGLGGMGGLGGLGGLSGLGGLGGLSGLSPMYGLGLAPGFGGLPGAGGIPGVTGFPGVGQWQGLSGWPGGYAGAFAPGQPGTGGRPGQFGTGGPLDGAWELDKGGVVIIRGSSARLYLSREQYQDFDIAYDQTYFWWAPRARSNGERYRYQLRDGRMILQDADGNYLLLRRRR